MSEDRSKDIVMDLRKSFLEEKKSLQDQIVEAETQIRQCKDFIESLSKRDDCDYNVFSPRSASRVYKDQVDEKKKQIETLEGSVRELYKKLSNVTKKLDSLGELKPGDLIVSKEEERESSLSNKAKYLKLQEYDRQRIAADLHDGVLQNLSLVMHNLELSSKFIDYDPIRAKLEIESNRKLVKEIIDEIRGTIFDLRPMQFDDFGFKRTLENQIANYKTRTSMEINASIDELSGLDNIYLITVFRVTQELMVNAIKHSEGTAIDITIRREGSEIVVIVSDNGKGMNIREEDLENHFGLKILKERVSVIGGTVSFSNSANGTVATVKIPIALKEM